MRELTNNEIQEVNGGPLPFIIAGLLIEDDHISERFFINFFSTSNFYYLSLIFKTSFQLDSA